MAQGLVTYKGGATVKAQSLEGLVEPSKAFVFFSDGMTNDPFNVNTTSKASKGLYGRWQCSNETTGATTSIEVLANAPSRLAFKCKGAFIGTGADGIVGLAEVAEGATGSSVDGVYFVVSGVESGYKLTFKVKDGAAVKTKEIAAVSTAESTYEFTYGENRFHVYVDGAIVAEIVAGFPAGDMRFIGGKTAGASANRFGSFDYVLCSVER